MATLQDIRRRIASVQNTRKITKAMQMVAAAKLRRAQQRTEALRPYAMGMLEMIWDLATYAEETQRYALLREHVEQKTVALLVVTGDRGLAGAFNANVLRRAIELEKQIRVEGLTPHLLVVGKKGIGNLRFRGYEIERTWTGLSDHPEYSDAMGIARHVIDLYTSEQVDRVQVVFNHFRSPLEQTVMNVRVLPIGAGEDIGYAAAFAESKPQAPVSYLYEPAAAAIYESLLPAYIEIAIQRALLESSASEQGARMTAMRNASDNAEEMIATLTLALNRARQASITQEILEVVAGAEALA